MKSKNVALGILLCVVAAGANVTVRAAAGKDEVKRVGAATTVLNEMGAQIGGTESDVILVIMNRSGVEHLLANQVKPETQTELDQRTADAVHRSR